MPDAISQLGLVEFAAKDVLKRAGFKKRARMWKKTGADVTDIVHLQRSQFGPRFFVNLGIYVHGIDDPSKDDPALLDCHLSTRLCQLVPNRLEFEEAVDAESGLDAKSREQRVSIAFEEVVLPFFESLSKKALIRAFLERPENRVLLSSSRGTLKKFFGFAIEI